MVALFISVILSVAAVIACMTSHISRGETIAAGVLSFLVSHFLIGFLVRRKIKKIQDELQDRLMQGQKKMNRKIQMFQTKPGGNIKQMQRQIETDQVGLITEALAFTKRFESFKKWNLLMGRQIVTMRLQFLYQLKKFEEVDQIFAAGLFRGPLMMEPMMIAMKMARQYKNGDIKGVEKTFTRRIKWFRGNRGTLLYGVMSWVYLQEGESEKARLLLIKGKETTGDETLSRNVEMLANNKDKSFSNAGLGEEWYGLYLEKPPAPKQQKARGNSRSGRRF